MLWIFLDWNKTWITWSLTKRLILYLVTLKWLQLMTWNVFANIFWYIEAGFVIRVSPATNCLFTTRRSPIKNVKLDMKSLLCFNWKLRDMKLCCTATCLIKTFTEISKRISIILPLYNMHLKKDESKNNLFIHFKSYGKPLIDQTTP